MRQHRAIRTHDISGQRFANVIACWPVGYKTKATVWLCVCDCGNLTYAVTAALKRGHKRNCGVCGPQCHSTHGMTRTPEYAAYREAKYRCSNSNAQAWKHYGGRGIEFRFGSFEEFLAEIGRRPTLEHSLDRRNNDGHYEPGNVRWATASEQSLNRRPRGKC